MNRILGLLKFSLIIICLSGCAATTRLPEHVMFVEPSPSITPELSAFLGIWTGKWYLSQDVTLVVEAVHPNSLEVIFSVGANALGGIYPQDTFSYERGEITSDRSFGWSSVNNNRFFFEMQDGYQEIKGVFIDGSSSAAINTVLHRVDPDALKGVTVHKYPYIEYSHPSKGRRDFDYEHDICWNRAESETVLLSHDVRKYKIWEAVGRCLREEFGWQPNAKDLKKDIKL